MWDFKNKQWNDIPGAAVRIAAGPNGLPIHVNSNNEIYLWTGDSKDYVSQGNKWTRLPGAAVDCAMGYEGSIWIAGTDKGVYNYVKSTNSWIQIDGAALQITAGPDGLPAVIGTDSVPYKRIDDSTTGKIPDDWSATEGAYTNPDEKDDISDCDPKYWELLTGAAIDIGISPEGNVWSLGTNQGIYYWKEDTFEWIQVPGAGVRIAVAP